MKIYFLIFLLSCARKEITLRSESLRRISAPPSISDDLDRKSFAQAITRQVKYIRKSKLPFINFQFGERKISTKDYLSSLDSLAKFLNQNESDAKWKKYIYDNFDFYEVYGREDYGDVFITSYFIPVIQGSLVKTAKFSHAVYKRPKDLVEIDVSAFNEVQLEHDPIDRSKIYGRIDKKKSRSGLMKIIPTFSRFEIDSMGALEFKNLEICYVDPVDLFFLQIQGSGIVRINGRKDIRIGFHGQNGHRYVAIGKFLVDKIPLKEMTMQKIEAELRRMSKKDREELLFKNPSYVFFKKLKGNPVTTLGTKIVSGRTIATDIKFFPKGALAFLEFSSPVLDKSGEVIKYVDKKRFVLDQDTGGAINGPGRIDLFWGYGDSAKAYAGIFKGKGKLYYLAPKNK